VRVGGRRLGMGDASGSGVVVIILLVGVDSMEKRKPGKHAKVSGINKISRKSSIFIAYLFHKKI